jgi:quinol monooxygenase YgiN
MNTVTAAIKVIDGKGGEFLQAIRSLQEKLKQETGFHKCTIYQDLSDENTFNIIEEWNTQDALDNHLKSDVFRALIGVLKILSVESEVRYRLVADDLGSKVYDVI